MMSFARQLSFAQGPLHELFRPTTNPTAIFVHVSMNRTKLLQLISITLCLRYSLLYQVDALDDGVVAIRVFLNEVLCLVIKSGSKAGLPLSFMRTGRSLQALSLKMPLRLSMSRSKATLNAVRGERLQDVQSRYLRRGVSGGRVTYYVHIYIYTYVCPMDMSIKESNKFWLTYYSDD